MLFAASYMLATFLAVGPASGQIRWADSVISFSSEFDTVAWAAYQILGPPDTYPNYGDIATAWSPYSQDTGREWIELYYNNPAPIRSVAIYETYNPGAVDTVYVRNPNTQQWQIVWSGTAAPTGVDAARILIVNFPLTSFNVTDIRLALNSPAVSGWNEIDAVAISASPIIVNRPDLVVSQVQAPSVGYSGQNIDVHWIVNNQGTASTTAPRWSDNVYLSTYPTFNADSSMLLGEAQNVSALDTGHSYANSQTYTLPQGISGNYYVYVVTNADLQQPELVDTNNTGRNPSPMTVNLTPPPDLQVASITTPSSVFSGDSVKISWTVKNFGSGSTVVGQWYDNLYLSNDSIFFIGTSHWLGFQEHDGILAPGSSYTTSMTVQIPDTIYGKYFLYVWTDKDNSVYEYVWKDNNIKKSDSIHVTLAPPPDLVVTNLTIPTTGSSGQQASIFWKVQNQGPGQPLDTVWHDRIYLSSLPTFNPDSAVALGTFSHTGMLLPDSSYLAQHTVYLPNGISGKFYVYAWTNCDNEVFEYTYTNNNVRRSDTTLQISLSPWPDLVAQSVQAPSNIVAGQQLSVTWTVKNTGVASATGSPWVDRFYISSSAVWDSSNATVFGEIAHNQALAPSGQYVQTAAFPLLGSLSGQYYIYLYTDATDLIYEYTGEGNNIGRSGSLTVQPYPPVDLAVKNLSVPLTDSSGRPMNVQWTVQNVGNAATLVSSWIDALYISTDTTLNPTSATLLAAILRNDPLSAGQSYTRNLSFTLPDGISGSYYVIVKTDTGNQVSDSNPLNNTVHSNVPVSITLSPPPDLQVESISIPPQTYAGQPVTISWTVQNTGAGAISGKEWYDAVYVSSNPGLDKNALKLVTQSNTYTLLYDSSYTDSLSVVLPSYIVGNNYYLLVQTDSRNDIYEGAGENNNVTGVPIVLSQLPASDLVVTAINIPDSATPGDLVTISWTIDNIDSNAAIGYITDGVYLSPDTAWSVDDPLIGTVPRYINLAMGGSARVQLKARIGRKLLSDSSGTITSPLPGAVPGPYHIIVRTNIFNNIPEINKVNNTMVSAGIMKLSFPHLQLGVPYNGSIANGQAAEYFYFTASAGSDYAITLTGSSVFDFNELFASYGKVPTRSTFDYAYTNQNAPNQQIIIPNAQAGQYYIMMDKLSADSAQFTLVARELAFAIDSVRYSMAGTGGEATVEIFGAKFRPGATASLRRAGYADVEDNSDYLVNSTQVNARFPTTGLATGTWDVVVTNPDSQKATLAGGLNIASGDPMELDLSFDGADTVRLNGVNPIMIYAHNPSNVNTQCALVFVELERPDVSLAMLTDPIPPDFEGWSQSNDTYFADDGNLAFVLELANIGAQRTKSILMPTIPLGLGHYKLSAVTYVLTRSDFDTALLQTIEEGMREGWFSSSLAAGSLGKLGAMLYANDDCGDDPGVCAAMADRQRMQDISKDAQGVVEDALNINPITPPKPTWLLKFARFLKHLLDFHNKYAPTSGYAFESVKPVDPNDLVGPAGAGDERWVAVTQTLPYIIHFENDPKQATAPAQQVTVTVQLDTTVDARSFRLGSFGFGSFTFADALNRSFYTQRLDVRDSLGIYVDVNSGVDVSTNSAFWIFKSIDTATGQLPANPMSGFLPVDDSLLHRGEAFVNFSVRPKSSSHTRDLIHTKARIVFDMNEPLDTRQLLHTIDAGLPASSVRPLPATSSADSFSVRWSGKDDSLGSGIRSYSIFVSQNNGPFSAWLTDVTDTTAVFAGTQGSTYQFFSIARDVAGNLEPVKYSADATTVVTAVRTQPSLPKTFALYQNYPNPFNPVTTLEYQLPVESKVRLTIYNILGQVVARLVEQVQQAGYKSARWIAANAASGIYFYRLEATSVTNPSKTFTSVKKMVLMK
jgi:hypothetical protein